MECPHPIYLCWGGLIAPKGRRCTWNGGRIGPWTSTNGLSETPRGQDGAGVCRPGHERQSIHAGCLCLAERGDERVRQKHTEQANRQLGSTTQDQSGLAGVGIGQHAAVRSAQLPTARDKCTRSETLAAEDVIATMRVGDDIGPTLLALVEVAHSLIRRLSPTKHCCVLSASSYKPRSPPTMSRAKAARQVLWDVPTWAPVSIISE